ncbi:MAG TPA: hypothetical protein VKV40_08165 [Ktedonobacteraceae bacterium]|nr:hypothetical protein [Ktedonobacteraceae bacterium]
MTRHKKKQFTLGNALVILGIVTLLGLAIREQLRMPEDQRAWHGPLCNIPYDFRWPTIERLRETFWNKHTSHVLVPTAFGMGWSINFSPLINPPSAGHTPETPVAK